MLLVGCLHAFLRLLWVFMFGGWCGSLSLAYLFVVCCLLAFVVFVFVIFWSVFVDVLVADVRVFVVACCCSLLSFAVDCRLRSPRTISLRICFVIC